MAEVKGREGMGGNSGVRVYNFSYPDLLVPVELDTNTGKERIRDKKVLEELERRFQKEVRSQIAGR
jgi:hypothetical protein